MRPGVRSGVLVAAVLLLAGCGGDGDGELVLFAGLGSGAGAPTVGSAEITAEGGWDALGLSGPASVRGAPELPDQGRDERRFAFVLSGCQEDSARLDIDDGVARAELVGGDDVVCDAPAYFLAVFDVPAADVPDGVVLG